MEVQQVSVNKTQLELELPEGHAEQEVLTVLRQELEYLTGHQGQLRKVEATPSLADAENWPDWLVLSGRPGDSLYVHGPFWSEEAAIDFAAVFGPDTPWRVKQCEAGLDKQWRHR
jgi:hypothetical protein